jgi:hypothetical protein
MPGRPISHGGSLPPRRTRARTAREREGGLVDTARLQSWIDSNRGAGRYQYGCGKRTEFCFGL